MTDDRTQFLGSSDVASVLNISPWKSQYRLYLEKIGAVVDEPTPEKIRLFARGKRWEPVVVEMLVDELEDRGHDVLVIGRNLRFPDTEHPFLRAEIDLLLQLDGEVVNGEMKTVHPFAAKEWGEPGSDDIPLHYAAQCMHGLMVTGRRLCSRRLCIVAALIGADDLRIHQIERDDETIAAMRARELEFWRRVQERDPPDPSTADDIRWLYGKDAGEVMDADDELLTLCRDLASAKAIEKQATDAVESLSTRLKLAIGNAAILQYGGRKVATWKTNKDSTLIDWQAAYRDLAAPPEHIKQFTTNSAGNRPLLLKKGWDK
jgi:putative phage-type endonuclease